MIPIERRTELLKVIAHPVRIKILEDLVQGVKCVSDFEETEKVVGLLSGLVDFFVDGRLKCFFLKEPLIPDLLELLKKEYEEDVPAPACCPVTKKGTYPGERRR